jgi:hypothetical protein
MARTRGGSQCAAKTCRVSINRRSRPNAVQQRMSASTSSHQQLLPKIEKAQSTVTRKRTSCSHQLIASIDHDVTQEMPGAGLRSSCRHHATSLDLNVTPRQNKQGTTATSSSRLHRDVTPVQITRTTPSTSTPSSQHKVPTPNLDCSEISVQLPVMPANGHNRSAVKTVRQKRGRSLKWNEADMTAAVNIVKSSSNISVRKAAVLWNVPRTTLRDRLDGRVALGAKPGRKPHLNFSLEEKLVDYASNRAKLGIGFGKSQFLQYAGSLAKKHKMNFKQGTPSNKWWRLMRRRHGGKILLRQPEGTAAVRHQCMDAVKVSKYFFALNSVLSATGIAGQADRIWNMDETGLQLDVKPRKVIATKGTKHLHSRTSGNRETITVIACVSAAGKALPPHIIVKGKTQRSLMGFNTEVAPQGTNWSWSETGWTKQGLAKLWFTNTFLANIGPDRPQVLVLDGHDSHNFLEMIELARENQIEIVELPSHTSNWLQPCDRTLFKPLKDYYREEAQELMSKFPGIVTCRSNFTGLFVKAWEKSMTNDNIVSGFKACGIHPFNPSAIPCEAYMPNYLYTVEQIMQNPDIVERDVNTHVAVQTTDNDTNATSESQAPSESSVELSLIDESCLGAAIEEIVNNLVISAPLTPDEALQLMESQLTAEQVTTYNYQYANDFNLAADSNYMTWRELKLISCHVTMVGQKMGDSNIYVPDMQTEASCCVSSSQELKCYVPITDNSQVMSSVDNVEQVNGNPSL